MRASLVGALFIAGILDVQTAGAAPRFLSISTEGCADLHADEIDRVLRIELAMVAAGWVGSAPLEVSLACEGAQVQVTAFDPLTQKKLGRELDFSGLRRERERDRDRTVALVVSQLFLTSWAELLLEERKEVVASVARRPAAPPPPVVTKAAEQMARDAADAPAGLSFSMALAGGVRARALSSPILGLRAALRPRLDVGALVLLAEAGYERGATARPLGTVEYGTTDALVGAALPLRFSHIVGFELGLAAGASYFDVRGAPGANAIGGSTTGVLGQAVAFAGPRFAIGSAHVGIELTGGATFPRGAARVGEGRDLDFGGLFVGAALAVTSPERDR